MKGMPNKFNWCLSAKTLNMKWVIVVGGVVRVTVVTEAREA